MSGEKPPVPTGSIDDEATKWQTSSQPKSRPSPTRPSQQTPLSPPQSSRERVTIHGTVTSDDGLLAGVRCKLYRCDSNEVLAEMTTNESGMYTLTADVTLRPLSAPLGVPDSPVVQIALEKDRYKSERRSYNSTALRRQHLNFKRDVRLPPAAPVAQKLDLRREVFSNPERLWLSYETRFNWPLYLKSNQQLELKLYRMPLPKVLLILAEPDDLDGPTLQTLAGVFFPGVEKQQLLDYGAPPWRIKDPRKLHAVISDSKQKAGGNQGAAMTQLYAILPYNLNDNTAESRAIGTRTQSRHRTPLERISETLPMWNTASRSSVVKIEQKLPPGGTKIEPAAAPYLWEGYAALNPQKCLHPLGPGAEFRLPDDPHRTAFSVKSGVNIVGFHAQSKDNLEANSILACMRSSYIREVEKKLKFDSYNDPKLLILTEIVTVTEKDPNWNLWLLRKLLLNRQADHKLARLALAKPQPGDGYQIRSLRGMNADRQYFPPLCIPFVKILPGSGKTPGDGNIDPQSKYMFSVDPQTHKHQPVGEGQPHCASMVEQLDDPHWQEFWKVHYALALGRAKARLLLRYGLQGFGGNAQNFLIETRDGAPNGRMVIRDMGDYALHDFVLWALWGPRGEAPPDPRKAENRTKQRAIVARWKTAFAQSEVLKFECDFMHELDPHEYPTFTGYHRSGDHATFNPNCPNCQKGGSANFVGHISPLWAYALPVSPQRADEIHADVNAGQLARLFEIEEQWGLAHNQAWLGFIEKALGQKFPVDWDEIKPGAYRLEHQPGLDRRAKAGDPGFNAIKLHWMSVYEKMKTFEMALGWQVENFLATEEGQTRLRAYQAMWQQLDTEL